MEADPSEIKFMKEAFSVRRSIMIEGLSAIPGLIVNEPEGAFYLFPKVSTLFGSSFGNRKIENALDLCMYLLEEAHVATVDGAAFGADEYIRISYATSDEILKEAIRRISNAISKLVK
jgi:aspartate aminotransferase